MLQSEGKISAAPLGRAGHFYGIDVIQSLGVPYLFYKPFRILRSRLKFMFDPDSQRSWKNPYLRGKLFKLKKWREI
jgi:hypothetical protein